MSSPRDAPALHLPASIVTYHGPFWLRTQAPTPQRWVWVGAHPSHGTYTRRYWARAAYGPAARTLPDRQALTSRQQAFVLVWRRPDWPADGIDAADVGHLRAAFDAIATQVSIAPATERHPPVIPLLDAYLHTPAAGHDAWVSVRLGRLRPTPESTEAEPVLQVRALPALAPLAAYLPEAAELAAWGEPVPDPRATPRHHLGQPPGIAPPHPSATQD